MLIYLSPELHKVKLKCDISYSMCHNSKENVFDDISKLTDTYSMILYHTERLCSCILFLQVEAPVRVFTILFPTSESVKVFI